MAYRSKASFKKLASGELAESAALNRALARDLADNIASAAQMVIDCYNGGGKVLLIGNGGSAADAHHIAAELVGRFKLERSALPAISLATDTSVITAVANDYGYGHVFSRQIEALASERDVLIAITTSGTSPNILRAIKTARSKGLKIISLTGNKSEHVELIKISDLTIEVPSKNIARIQEAHTTIGHIICFIVEKEIFGKQGSISR